MFGFDDGLQSPTLANVYFWARRALTPKFKKNRSIETNSHWKFARFNHLRWWLRLLLLGTAFHGTALKDIAKPSNEKKSANTLVFLITYLVKCCKLRLPAVNQVYYISGSFGWLVFWPINSNRELLWLPLKSLFVCSSSRLEYEIMVACLFCFEVVSCLCSTLYSATNFLSVLEIHCTSILLLRVFGYFAVLNISNSVIRLKTTGESLQIIKSHKNVDDNQSDVSNSQHNTELWISWNSIPTRFSVVIVISSRMGLCMVMVTPWKFVTKFFFFANRTHLRTHF